MVGPRTANQGIATRRAEDLIHTATCIPQSHPEPREMTSRPVPL
jgi:hypothetical protein